MTPCSETGLACLSPDVRFRDGADFSLVSVGVLLDRDLVPDGRGKKRVGRLLKHLTRFSDALAHDEIRDAGLPVGSGEVESAHRTIPQKRLKLPGAGWRPDTVPKMLGLRVLRANGWWADYWKAAA